MNTDSRRTASAAYHTKRKAEGWRKVTVWLDPANAAKVDALKAAAGSADEVHRQAIEAWAGPPQTDASEPKAEHWEPSKGDPTPRATHYRAPTTPKPAAKSQPSGLQFGARKAEPGSRLKGGKG